MLNKNCILDYLRTHNWMNENNKTIIENIIGYAEEFFPNYQEAVQFIQYAIFGKGTSVPGEIFLSERECKILYGLCYIDCVDSVLNPILCKKGQELPTDLETILKLYDETGNKIIFAKNGECTPWTASIAWPKMMEDIWDIYYKFEMDYRINPDDIESELETIVRRGF